MTSSAAPPVPLFGSAYFQNPHPVFAWLRDHAPVHEFAFPVGGVRTWLVTRYDDVKAVLAEPRFSSEDGTWGNAEFEKAGLVSGAESVPEKAVTVVDPPPHTRLRRLAMSTFTPRRIAQWRQSVEQVVASVLDACAPGESST
ncbi:hypothetical protein ACFYZJ_17535 [Streptomyces sp. NPDC001848]|uniref:hypothetical protein n=1 Tax=Streptomyces sp. NPDC001848 TaxID=3364618 RepID=UPI00368904C0